MSDQPRTTAQALSRATKLYGDSIAIKTPDSELTFAQVEQLSICAAQRLKAQGVTIGDRVAIWAPNSWQWAISLFASHLVGAAVVPISTRFKPAEALYVLEKTKAKVLASVGSFLGRDLPGELETAWGIPNSIERVVYLDDQTPAGSHNQRIIRFSRMLDDQANKAQLPEIDPDTISDIMFTSGTTGSPKGVITTQEQTMRVFATWSRSVGLQRNDRYLIVNPFFHTFGYKAGIIACLLSGAAMYPLPVFDVDEALEIIETQQISVLPGPPTIYYSLLASPRLREADLTSLRLAVTGASSVPESLVDDMRHRLGFETVLTAYGLTESCGTVTMCTPEDDTATVSRTCGKPIDGVEVKLIDSTGGTCIPGQPGEVLVRGYNVMKGYLDDPLATAEAIDEQGWLHTGDIATIDPKGYLKITDRIKDMFIVGGFNAYPAEIEKLMLGHPSIAQVAVIGVPDDRLGEVGRAFVILNPGHNVGAQGIITWCRENMANYKVPRSIEFVDSLPVNAAGKVLKTQLRQGSSQGA